MSSTWCSFVLLYYVLLQAACRGKYRFRMRLYWAVQSWGAAMPNSEHLPLQTRSFREWIPNFLGSWLYLLTTCLWLHLLIACNMFMVHNLNRPDTLGSATNVIRAYDAVLCRPQKAQTLHCTTGITPKKARHHLEETNPLHLDHLL